MEPSLHTITAKEAEPLKFEFHHIFSMGFQWDEQNNGRIAVEKTFVSSGVFDYEYVKKRRLVPVTVLGLGDLRFSFGYATIPWQAYSIQLKPRLKFLTADLAWRSREKKLWRGPDRNLRKW